MRYLVKYEVVKGDIIQLLDKDMNKLYTLFGKTKQEVDEYFSKSLDDCVEMIINPDRQNKFTSSFIKQTGQIGSDLIHKAKLEVGCAGLSNPAIFNLRLPDQFIVKEIRGDEFTIDFLNISLQQEWNNQETSHFIRDYIRSLVFKVEPHRYYVMGSAM